MKTVGNLTKKATGAKKDAKAGAKDAGKTTGGAKDAGKTTDKSGKPAAGAKPDAKAAPKPAAKPATKQPSASSNKPPATGPKVAAPPPKMFSFWGDFGLQDNSHLGSLKTLATGNKTKKAAVAKKDAKAGAKDAGKTTGAATKGPAKKPASKVQSFWHLGSFKGGKEPVIKTVKSSATAKKAKEKLTNLAKTATGGKAGKLATFEIVPTLNDQKQYWDSEHAAKTLQAPSNNDVQPDLAAFISGEISGAEFFHLGSFKKLMGGNKTHHANGTLKAVVKAHDAKGAAKSGKTAAPAAGAKAKVDTAVPKAGTTGKAPAATAGAKPAGPKKATVPSGGQPASGGKATAKAFAWATTSGSEQAVLKKNSVFLAKNTVEKSGSETEGISYWQSMKTQTYYWVVVFPQKLFGCLVPRLGQA